MLSTETFFLLLLLAFSTTVHATEELFSAIVHLERLLQTEQSIVANLNSYLDYEEKRIASLRQLAHHYNELNSVASKDVQSYLSNPVNAYLLVKRLTTDWKLVEYLTFNADRRDLIEFLQQNETFPSSDDLTGKSKVILKKTNFVITFVFNFQGRRKLCFVFRTLTSWTLLYWRMALFPFAMFAV